MKINRRQFNYGLVVSLGSLPFVRLPLHPQLRVNQKRIMDHLLALAEFGKNPQGGVSRVAYSDADKQGREYVLGLMRAAKLEVVTDAAGNLIGRRAGTANNLSLCSLALTLIPFPKEETTTVWSVQWVRLKLHKRLLRTTSTCVIHSKSSFFRMKKAD
jgi:hypothetical protein